jgi:hypothetical protein
VRPSGENDGPRSFVRKWLGFDESRPVRTRLFWKFIAVVAACLAASGLLALIAA